MIRLRSLKRPLWLQMEWQDWKHEVQVVYHCEVQKRDLKALNQGSTLWEAMEGTGEKY